MPKIAKKPKTKTKPARRKRIRVSLLNISMAPPHGADRYRKLLRDCYRQSIEVPYRGNTHAMIGSIVTAPVNGVDMLAGRILAFDHIGRRWLDKLSKEEATPEVMQQIKVPDHVVPNMEDFHFLFDPERHRLAFDARLGPTNGLRIFERMLKQMEGSYGDIAVTLVQTHEGLEKIFAISELRKLTIFIARPNPDDLESIEEEVRRRLEANNAETQTLEYTYHTGGLTPDKMVKDYAKVALSNGYVKGEGVTPEGAPIKESTKQHPQTYTHTYVDDDPKKTLADHFRDAARSVLGRVVKRKRNDD